MAAVPAAPAPTDRWPAVLATDLDRTFSRADLTLDDDAFSAAADLRRRGVRLVLATGRGLAVLDRHPRLAQAFDAYVMEGGAVWGTPARWTLTVPDLDPVARLRRALAGLGVAVEPGRASFSIAAGDAPLLHGLAEAGRVGLRMNRDRIDVTPQGVDKSVALRRLLAEWGVPARRVVAVGDGENDAEMLALAGHGVAVANAVPGLKAVAREVAPLPAAAGFAWLARRLLASP